MRDSRNEFSAKTKTQLAKRVNYLCSNPSCRALTSAGGGPAESAVCLGEAARITAASPGGPRYCEEMTPEQRSDASNRIWLCRNCAALIDRDVERYTVEVLCGWKTHAEAFARNGVGKPIETLIDPGSSKATVTFYRRDIPPFAFAFTTSEIHACFMYWNHREIPFNWDVTWVDKAAIAIAIQNPSDGYPLIIDALDNDSTALDTRYESGLLYIPQGVSRAIELLVIVSDEKTRVNRLEREFGKARVVDLDFFESGGYIEVAPGGTEVILLSICLAGCNKRVFLKLGILQNGERNWLDIPSEEDVKLVSEATIPANAKWWRVHSDGRVSGKRDSWNILDDYRAIVEAD